MSYKNIFNRVKRIFHVLKDYKKYYIIVMLFVILNLISELYFKIGIYTKKVSTQSVNDIMDSFYYLIKDTDWYSFLSTYILDFHLFSFIGLFISLFLYLLFKDINKLIHIMILVTVIFLIRMLCIPLTNLGPPLGQIDLNNGLGFMFGTDLFFSGHIAFSFVFLLVLRKSELFFMLLAFHILILVNMLIGRFHYTIDIVGAYAISYSVFKISERYINEMIHKLD